MSAQSTLLNPRTKHSTARRLHRSRELGLVRCESVRPLSVNKEHSTYSTSTKGPYPTHPFLPQNILSYQPNTVYTLTPTSLKVYSLNHVNNTLTLLLNTLLLYRLNLNLILLNSNHPRHPHPPSLLPPLPLHIPLILILLTLISIKLLTHNPIIYIIHIILITHP